MFLYFSTACQTLPYVTKDADKSEELYSSLTIEGEILDQLKN